MHKLFSALAAAALLALPISTHAQAAPAAGVITGFSSAAWGTPEAEIVARLGAPEHSSQDGPMKVIGYRDQVLGENVATWYVFGPQGGLVGGSYVVTYTYGDHCWTVYNKFKNAVAQRYPAIRPTVVEDNETSLDMCAAIGIRSAQVVSSWEDPENESMVQVKVNSDPRSVDTWYYSAEMLRLMEQRDAQQREDRF